MAEANMEQCEGMDIPNPCIGVCEMDRRGYCRGCLRSREERYRWLSYSVAEKQQVMQRCHQRDGLPSIFPLFTQLK